MSNDHDTAGGFEVSTSLGFESWLVETEASLAFTTYDAGKLFFVGLEGDGRLAIFNRDVGRCMGIAVEGRSLFLATLVQILRFEDACFAEVDPASGLFDAAYLPQVGYFTGFVDAHDLALDGDRRLLFANTAYNCVATVSESHSFVPVWRPSFISELVREDRCHLNGLAMENGRLRCVTVIARSDVGEGWREHRDDGGVLIDCDTNEVVVSGLSMPHSPHIHQGQIWLLDSGSGHFGRADVQQGAFEPVTFCPGYLRGLTLFGDYAIVGISKPRDERTFSGLRLDIELERRQLEPQCGLCVIDLRSGELVHWFWMQGGIRELYDVAILPKTRKPMLVGFRTNDIRRAVSIGDDSQIAGIR